jgi:hypothetical protein
MIMGLQSARKDFVAEGHDLVSSRAPFDLGALDTDHPVGSPHRLDPLIAALSRAIDRLGAARSSKQDQDRAI